MKHSAGFDAYEKSTVVLHLRICAVSHEHNEDSSVVALFRIGLRVEWFSSFLTGLYRCVLSPCAQDGAI